MSTERSARRLAPLIAALTVLALLVRLVGVDFGVPVWEEPDPDIPIHVDLLRDDSVRANKEFSERQYPHLIARLVSLLPARPAAGAPDAPVTVEQHLDNAAHTHVQARRIVALLSALLVPLTYLLARRFLRPGAAGVAAALVATSLLHTHFAQQGRPHGAAATFFLASVLCSMHLVRRADTRMFLWCGLTAGLAVGALHSGVAVLIPLLVGYLLRAGPEGGPEGARTGRPGGLRLDPRAVLPVLLIGASIWIFYPFLFDGSAEARPAAANSAEPQLEDTTVVWAEHSVGLSQFAGGGFRVVLESLWNYDPVLLLAGAAGALAWLLALVLGARQPWTDPDAAARRRQLLVALSFALPYLLVIGLFEKTYERFAIPLLPYMACAAAWGLDAAARRWRWSRSVRVLAATALLVLPTAATLKLVWLRSQPDTLEQAAAWIEQHARPAPGGTTVWLQAPLDLPLLRAEQSWSPPGRRRRLLYSPWSRYQVRAVPAELGPRWDLRWIGPAWADGESNLATEPEAFVEALAPGLFLIEVFEERTDHPVDIALRQALRARGTLVERFAPEGPEAGGAARSEPRTEQPFFYQLSDHFNDGERAPRPHFIPRLFAAQAVGPVLELYRVE